MYECCALVSNIVEATFCYLGDMFSAGGGCDHAIAARWPPSAIWATCFRLVVVAITLLLLAVVRPGASSESCCQFSLQSTSLSRYAARCSQLTFGQLCSMVVRPGPQTPLIYNGFAEMTVP